VMKVAVSLAATLAAALAVLAVAKDVGSYDEVIHHDGSPPTSTDR
jgi:hypothetical protein